MKKREMINTILNSLKSYELEMIVPVEEKDTAIDVAIKIETIFNSFTKEQLKTAYTDAIRKLKYENVGLIS